MGQFSVRVTIANPIELTRSVEVELVVDTGATFSWVPRDALEQIDAPRLGRRPFVLADGRKIERDTAGAIVKLNGTSVSVTLVVAEPGDGHLLGATTLESLGLGVDPIQQRLVPHILLAMCDASGTYP